MLDIGLHSDGGPPLARDISSRQQISGRCKGDDTVPDYFRILELGHETRMLRDTNWGDSGVVPLEWCTRAVRS